MKQNHSSCRAKLNHSTSVSLTLLRHFNVNAMLLESGVSLKAVMVKPNFNLWTVWASLRTKAFFVFALTANKFTYLCYHLIVSNVAFVSKVVVVQQFSGQFLHGIIAKFRCIVLLFHNHENLQKQWIIMSQIN